MKETAKKATKKVAAAKKAAKKTTKINLGKASKAPREPAAPTPVVGETPSNVRTLDLCDIKQLDELRHLIYTFEVTGPVDENGVLLPGLHEGKLTSAEVRVIEPMPMTAMGDAEPEPDLNNPWDMFTRLSSDVKHIDHHISHLLEELKRLEERRATTVAKCNGYGLMIAGIVGGQPV